jgi:tetratricopeptide (TPR) repeat protein
MGRNHTSGISGYRYRASLLDSWTASTARIFVAVVCLTGPWFGLAQEEAPQEPATAVTTELPEDIPSLEQRGDLYMVRKYYAEAVRVYSRLTQREPNNALFQNKLGIAYHQMQDLNSAQRAYRRAIQLNPQYAQAINNLASVEYAQKKYRNAILTYLRALKLTPGDAVIYGNLGTAYFAREEFEYATQSFRYALQLDPEVFRRSGRVGTIVQQRDEGNPAVFNFYMAKTYASTGNVDETLQFLIKAWEAGYPDLRKVVLEEEEFKFLAVDPRFEQLLALMESSGDASATTPIQQ